MKTGKPRSGKSVSIEDGGLSDNRYRALFEHSRDAIYLHDLKGRFLDANPAALELLGYSPEEISSVELSTLLTSEDDVARAFADMEELLGDGPQRELSEYELRRKDGNLVWVEILASVVYTGDQPVAIQGIARDVTERKRVEESLRLKAHILDNIGEAVIATDAQGTVLYTNRFAEKLYGWSAEEMVGRDVLEFTVPQATREQAEEIMARLNAGQNWSGEFQVQRRDGESFTAFVTNSPVRDEDGAISAIVGISSDISERKEAEKALHGSEERYRNLVELVHDLVWAVDLEGRITYVSPGTKRLYGREPEEMIGRPFSDFLSPKEATCTPGELEDRLANGESLYRFRSRVYHRDGHEVVLLASAAPLRDADGNIVGMAGTSQDITAQEAAENELRNSEERFRTAIMLAPFPVMIHAEDGEVITVNQAWTDITGYTLEDIPTIRDWTEKAYGEEKDEARARIAALYELDGTVGGGSSIVSTTSGKRRTWVWGSKALGRAPDGRRLVISMANDISEREQVEAELRLQSAALNAAGNAILITDHDGRIEWVNEAFVKSTGYDSSEVIGKPAKTVLSGINGPESYESLRSTVLAGRVWRGEITNRRKDGSSYPEEVTITPVKNDRGEPTHFVAIKRDLSEVRRLEAQFLQSQKMETVGRLAGGIAHDFNNLLTVINGTADVAATDLSTGDPLRADLEAIHQAGERAAALTRQLLAFSRRQVLQPVDVNVADLLSNWRSMLQRLIGETIELAIVQHGEVGSVRVDPSQMEQVIMNLVVNAGDAMPDGGKLTIEIEDVEIDDDYAASHSPVHPGPHVMLTVTDTGVGMDEATRTKLFEPFFTTKEPEKGTGLGLAMVYGTIAQSGGSISVESELGRGTTFRIYLPRIASVPSDSRAKHQSSLVPGTETILLVEDEEALRRLAERILTTSGYTVLSAANASEAMELLERHEGSLHLIFTDVVLPTVSGRILAAEVARKHPGVKILYTSGYTDDVVLRHGVLDQTTHFLGKPYSPTALTRKIRDVLSS